MKLAVTGFSGIIGRQLLKLLTLKYPLAEVLLIGRRIDDKQEIERHRFICLDILSVKEDIINKIFKNEKIDYIFHLAWDTCHDKYLYSTENEQWEARTLVLIRSFYDNGGIKFIGIGTSLEYDTTLPAPYLEYDSLLNGGVTSYGRAKLAVYRFLEKEFNNRCFLWCRVFYVFGPGQEKTRLVPQLISAVNKPEKEIKIIPNLKVDYLSTFEVAKQLLLMFETDYSGSVNISSGYGLNIKEMVGQVEIATRGRIYACSEDLDVGALTRDLYGCNDLLKKYYPEYKYTEKDLQRDLKLTITAGN